MLKMIVAMFALLVLSGCAHKELKAPCENIAALTANSIPCDQREPVNERHIPSVFAN